MASISIRHGTEGPVYDPYGYGEITITLTNDKVIVYHCGLAEWCLVYYHGKREKYHSYLYNGETDDKAAAVFEKETGLTPIQAERYYNRLHHPKKCRKCGSRQRISQRGHPGETLWCCSKCERVVSVDMNWSVIE